GELGGQALECLTRGGTLLVFGALSLQPLALNSGTLIFKDLSVRSFWLTTWFPALSSDDKQRISKEVLGMLAQQQLKTNVEATYPLDEVVQAVAHADSSGRDGKVLLVME
ncbi:MAG: zinc-binding dehydrogenase, partial [Tunicatimonas sp.]